MKSLRLVVDNTHRIDDDERGDGLGNYLEWLYALGLAEKTIQVYQRAVQRWLIWCVTEQCDPTICEPVTLAEYAQDIPQTATSRRQHRVALRHWFDSLGVDSAAVKAIRVPPKKRGVCRALEPHEAARLAQTAIGNHPYGTAVLLGLYLGLRREEIARARWDRFNRDASWYTVLGKRDITAELPVHPILKQQAIGMATLYPWVFPGRNAGHVAPATIGEWVGKLSVEAGIGRVTAHRLRHTAIATINDATGDLRAAQEFARHASPETTRLYTRVSADRLKRAVDSLNFAAA